MGHKLYLYENFYSTGCYKNNFLPLVYLQGGQSFQCTVCPTRFINDISESFSVDHNKVMWTSFKDGIVCIDYDTEVTECGDYLIVDVPEVKRYLSLYAQHEHWLNRMSSHEQGSDSKFQAIHMMLSNYYNKAYGALLLRGIDRRIISGITVDRHNVRFMRDLPELYKTN